MKILPKRLTRFPKLNFLNINYQFNRLILKFILSQYSKEKHKSYDQDFQKLQKKYNVKHDYGYDPFSTWKRAANRIIWLLEKFDLKTSGLNVLDAACGDGMFGVLLNSYGHNSFLVDFEDWRDERSKNLPFLESKLENLAGIKSNEFDLICSYNSFEHLENPKQSFQELLRVCKPGGYIFLEFGPIYTGPWGLHAYRTLRMPYPQYLFSEEFINDKLNELGMYDLGRKQTLLQPLNKWNYHEFQSLWENNPKVEIVSNERLINEKFLNVIVKYPTAFRGRGLSYLDVTTQGIWVMLKKNE